MLPASTASRLKLLVLSRSLWQVTQYLVSTGRNSSGTVDTDDTGARWAVTVDGCDATVSAAAAIDAATIILVTNETFSTSLMVWARGPAPAPFLAGWRLVPVLRRYRSRDEPAIRIASPEASS